MEQKLDQMLAVLAEANRKADMAHQAVLGLREEVAVIRRDNVRLEGLLGSEARSERRDALDEEVQQEARGEFNLPAEGFPIPSEPVVREEQQSRTKPPRADEVRGRQHTKGPEDACPDWKQEMMAELNRRLGAHHGQTPADLAEQAVRGINRTALADWIQSEPKPKDFITLTIKVFEGKSDPLNYIYQFQQKMALETRNEALICKVFSTTLAGPALSWFRQLPERSINGFEDLCKVFLKQYASARRQQKTMRDLDRMEQSAAELPRDYLSRFLDVMSQIHNADSVQAANSFVRGLQPGSMLSDHLLLNLPYDMADVQAKSEGVFRVLESHQRAPKLQRLLRPCPHRRRPQLPRERKGPRQLKLRHRRHPLGKLT